jgi:hypothetical protein
MWWRGNLARSNNNVQRPKSARIVEVVDPAGPPPITMQS